MTVKLSLTAVWSAQVPTILHTGSSFPQFGIKIKISRTYLFILTGMPNTEYRSGIWKIETIRIRIRTTVLVGVQKCRTFLVTDGTYILGSFSECWLCCVSRTFLSEYELTVIFCGFECNMDCIFETTLL